MLECMDLLDKSAWIQAVESECWSAELQLSTEALS